MTATRDPDRLIRAWLELMPDEAPDRVVSAVLQAAEAAPQVRAWPWAGIRRTPRMNRLLLVAATALVAVALFGGAILFTGGSNGPTGPSPSPTPSPTAAPTPTTEPVAAFPEALWGLWVADAAPIPGLPNQGSRITALFDWEGGRDFSIGTNFILGETVLESFALAATEGQFRLRTVDATDGCVAGDVGTYQWDRSSNGLFLSVSLVSDPCAVRAATLARTWVRTHGVANDGRTGMAAMTDPFPDIQVTLPSQAWAMDVLPPIDIHTYGDGVPGRDLVILAKPQGYEKPCTRSLAFPIDDTPEALLAYVQALPNVEGVSSEAVTIDGRPAMHITASYPTNRCAEAADYGFLKQLRYPGDNGGTGEIVLSGGEQISLWATRHDGDLIVFWYAGETVPAAEERAVIDSIRITNGLPTP